MKYHSLDKVIVQSCDTKELSSGIFESHLFLVKAANVDKHSFMRQPACEVIPEESNFADSDDDLIEDTGPLLVNVGIPLPEPQSKRRSNHWVRKTEVSLST